jgi:hypothetical protein
MNSLLILTVTLMAFKILKLSLVFRNSSSSSEALLETELYFIVTVLNK